MAVARRLMLPDFPMGTPGQTLVVQADGTINWQTASSGGAVTITTMVADSGTTDNASILTSDLTALNALGGGEYWIPIVPGKFYGFATAVSLAGLKNIRIKAVAFGSQADLSPALVFSGTGSNPFILFDHPTGVSIEGLNFKHTSSSFTGPLLALEDNANVADCFRNRVAECAFLNDSNFTTAIGLRISSFLKGVIERCDFAWLSRAIVWGDPSSAGGQYVNGTILRDSSFAETSSNPIYLSGADTEACVFSNLTFEPRSDGLAGCFEGNGSIIYPCIFANIFMAEGASNGGTVFKSMYTSGRSCTILGGEIGGPTGNGFGATGSTAFDLKGTWTIIGTTITGGPGANVFADPGGSQFGLNLIGCLVGGGCSMFAGTLPAPFTNLTNLGTGTGSLPYCPPSVNQSSNSSPNPLQISQLAYQGGSAYFLLTNASAKTVTIHPQSDGAQYVFPVPFVVHIVNASTTAAHVVTSGGPPPTLNAANGAFVDAGQTCTLIQTAVDTWYMAGAPS